MHQLIHLECRKPKERSININNCQLRMISLIKQHRFCSIPTFPSSTKKQISKNSVIVDVISWNSMSSNQISPKTQSIKKVSILKILFPILSIMINNMISWKVHTLIWVLPMELGSKGKKVMISKDHTPKICYIVTGHAHN